jgi:hypothetical protein
LTGGLFFAVFIHFLSKLRLRLDNADVLDQGHFLEAVHELPRLLGASKVAVRCKLHEELVSGNKNAMSSAICQIERLKDLLVGSVASSSSEGVADAVLHPSKDRWFTPVDVGRGADE